jgi:hypothetical protein
VTRPRQSPPTVRIHGRVVPMSGNSRDGYRLRIDELFMADLVLSKSRDNEVTQTNWYIKTHGGILTGGFFNGCHEQQAANCISRWFAARAKSWQGADGGRTVR